MLQKIKHQLKFIAHYRQYKHKVYHFFTYRLQNDKELAEDLTSETFIKAYLNFATYNKKYAFSTWIYRIARNHLIDYKRAQNTSLTDLNLLQNIISNDELPSEIAKTNLELDLVKAEMKSLPKNQKQCLYLKYFKDYANRDIALALDLTEVNVRKLMSRGLNTLRQNLNKLN